jgi:DNA polymerase I-like protein with 3'-5' exonuclease and polymerase domains
MLSAGYGAGARKLSALLHISVQATRELMDAHKRRYPRYWEFSGGVVETVQSGHELRTPLGWRATPTRNSDFNPRSAANWPHQATCADILRVAVVMARKRGIEVCAPVHDALLVEGPDDAADELAATMREVWRDASRAVLRGCALTELRSDATIVRSGSRYSDPRGAETWRFIVDSVCRFDADVDGPAVSGPCPNLGPVAQTQDTFAPA